MKYDIVNPYSGSDILKQPVSQQAFVREELIALLNEGISSLYSSNVKKYERARGLTSVRTFNEFLIQSKRELVDVGESLLEEFRTFYQKPSGLNGGKVYEQITIDRAIDSLRSAINEHLFKKGYIQRKILCKKPYEKYKTFLRLTGDTQRLILTYEKDGRKVITRTIYYEDPLTKKETVRSAIQRKATELSNKNRADNIKTTISLLGKLKKKGLEDLTQDDLEKLLKAAKAENKECAMNGYLKSLRSVVSNGVALKILKNNPFDGFEYEEKTYSPKNDFIMDDQIDRILNLDTLNWKDLIEVRDRCITLTGYDTALRATSLVLLDVKNFIELSNGEYQLNVKYVKGRTTNVDMNLLFDSTIKLLKFWINVARPKFKPKGDSLFVSNQGAPLTYKGIRQSIQHCCQLLAVKTQKGLVPTPHTLRHTFATLNIEPYGKGLNTREMQERLIHVSQQMVETVYIHNNPYAKMEQAKKLRQKDSRMGAFGRISQEDFFKILDTLTIARPSAIKEIKDAYQKTVESKKSGLKCGEPMISEHEALEMLAPFSVNSRSLRSWGFKESVCNIEIGNKGKKYFYRKNAVEDLVKSYVPFREALKNFSGSRPHFYRQIKRCQRVTIGNETLLLKDDVFELLINKQARSKDDMVQLKSA